MLLVGPRQAGKSTLVQGLASGGHPARYLILDDLRTLDAARRDPIGLIESVDGSLIIDEVQRAPELLLPIKAAIDRDRPWATRHAVDRFGRRGDRLRRFCDRWWIAYD